MSDVIAQYLFALNCNDGGIDQIDLFEICPYI